MVDGECGQSVGHVRGHPRYFGMRAEEIVDGKLSPVRSVKILTESWSGV